MSLSIWSHYVEVYFTVIANDFCTMIFAKNYIDILGISNIASKSIILQKINIKGFLKYSNFHLTKVKKCLRFSQQCFPPKKEPHSRIFAFSFPNLFDSSSAPTLRLTSSSFAPSSPGRQSQRQYRWCHPCLNAAKRTFHDNCKCKVEREIFIFSFLMMLSTQH
jgi:hypothetical protein